MIIPYYGVRSFYPMWAIVPYVLVGSVV